jgi:cysteinyl-tRNA synthetase
MHNGFVTVERRKMSKSLGNTLVVHRLLEEHPGEVLRYVLLGAHYRQPLDWSGAALEQARRTLDRMYGVLREAQTRIGDLEPAPRPGEAFLEALFDDLNTPVALAEMNRVARELAKAEGDEARALAAELLADGALIGLLQQAPDTWFGAGADGENAEIDRLVAERDEARARRDFAKADEIRDRLAAEGIVLEDGAGGTRWRRETNG